MSGATLKVADDSRCEVTGDLDFSSVPDIWPLLAERIGAGGELTVSLAGVDRANSAGLVMLVEARDRARDSACKLNLVDIPSALRDLAAMSGCDAIIAPEGA